MTAGQTKNPIVAPRNLRMMTSRHRVKTQITRALTQTIKLQMSVALDAWVGRDAINMCLHIWRYNMRVEIVRKIEHQVVNAKLLRHSASIINI